MDEASHRFGIPVTWIERVMAVESRGHTTLNGKPIASPAGAMGLMQIMPETWKYLRGRYGLGADPFDPHDSIFAGTAYLRELYDRYGYPNLFAAYNAGSARLDAYLGHGQALPAVTTDYVRQVAGAITSVGAVANTGANAAPENPLFFVNHTASRSETAPSAASDARAALFVALTTRTP